MTKRILIINQKFTSNLGDILIGQAMEKLFAEYEVEFLPYCSNDLLLNRRKKYWKLIDKLKLTTLVKDIIYGIRVNKLLKNKKYDLAIIGGGELLSANLDFNSAMLQWTKRLSKKKIPVIVAGISGNAVSKRIGKRYIEALKKCRFISVRDRVTQKIVEEDYHFHTEFCPDFVFSCNHINNIKKENLITVQIYSYDYVKKSVSIDTKEKYYELIYSMAQSSVTNGEKILYSYTDSDDKTATLDFKKYILEKHGKEIDVIDICSPEKLIEFLAKTKKIISGRMHPMIVGLLCENEVIPYITNDKIRCFQEEWLPGAKSDIYKAGLEVERLIMKIKSQFLSFDT